MLPIKLQYKIALETGKLSIDPKQAIAIDHLQELYDFIVMQQSYLGNFWLIIKKCFGYNPYLKRGLYLWGGVGRGKTYIMDSFFESLPIKNKLRLHYHRFMSKVHKLLKELGQQKDPLRKIAAIFEKQAKVLCFDEFFVKDITDAMLLGGLFKELIKLDVILVITSNIPPKDLYVNGLQRDRFLPAIKLIELFTTILNVDNSIDYRLRSLIKMQVFLIGINKTTNDIMNKEFTELAGTIYPEKFITILDRELPVSFIATNAVWFTCQALCYEPRSQLDYIEIARYYNTVFISNITIFTDDDNSAARRFIALIDELYEHRIKLFMQLETDINLIYQGHDLTFEFRRVYSRLAEMQTPNYLGSSHII